MDGLALSMRSRLREGDSSRGGSSEAVPGELPVSTRLSIEAKDELEQG